MWYLSSCKGKYLIKHFASFSINRNHYMSTENQDKTKNTKKHAEKNIIWDSVTGIQAF